MITEWQMYWLLRLDSFVMLSVLLCAISFVISLLFAIAGFINADTAKIMPKSDISKRESVNARVFFRVSKYGFVAFLVSMIVCAFVPDTKEMAVIIVTPRVINALSENEEIKQIPDNLVNLANSWIEELKPKEEKEQ